MHTRFGSGRWSIRSGRHVDAAPGAVRRRAVRLRIAAVAAGAAIAVAFAPTALATGMISQTAPNAFTVASGEPGYPGVTHFPIDIAVGSQVLTVVVRVPPGGSFGWHYHTAPLTVTVLQGTLTLYAPPPGYVEGVTPPASSCDHQGYGPGTGFLEEPNVVHLARNESGGLAVISVTYLGIAPGTNPDVYEDGGFQPCVGIS
jgi:quercetin dioxygenase-like cupin family protein